jgi:single-stranded-DNA-specific exonuclease
MLKYKLIGDNDYLFDPKGQILENRGIEDVNYFLNLDEKVTHSYKKLKNIDKAIDCIVKHIENQSKFLIIVDPDVDGFTSAAILYQYLKMIDGDIDIKWVLHDDKTHGFTNIEIPNNVDCILVPDGGSEDFQVHEELHKKGIDIVVIDHHEVEKESEYAIIVNSQLGGYPNLNLSGAGMVYKVCKALDDVFWTNYADYFLDLVALGNIADSMSMKELETRYYVQKGLQEINNDFFRALLRQQEFSTKGKVNITTINFYIAPLINAVIRVGNLKDKLDMFKSFIGIKELVKYKPRGSDEMLIPLTDDMARRCVNIKNRQTRMRDKAVKKIEDIINKYKLNDNKVLFIYHLEDIDKGLTGLIANQIASKYKKPTIILSGDNGEGVYKGSARGYDRGELKDFKEIILKSALFNAAKGHSNAFGVEIHKDQFNAVNEKLNQLLDKYSFEDVYVVDFEIECKLLNEKLIFEICELEDVWGKDVEEPYLAIKNININDYEVSLLGKQENTISIQYGDIKFMIFKTNKSEYEKIKNAKKIDVIGKANINIYNDQEYPQIIVEAYEIFT